MEIKRSEMIGYKIRLIHNQIHKRMEEKKLENEKEPLTGMQRWTLGYLSEHEGQAVYQRDIEEAFKISRATASNMLSVMERRGFIERQPVEHDARLKKIVMTDLACDTIKRANQDVKEMETLLQQGLSGEDVVHLKKCLDIILKNLGNPT
ncbi:MAG: MarR family transcriptional regulator [Clostridiales bacterium]|nr:MarR family transcriptional regulator [Clostridiales bacterium]